MTDLEKKGVSAALHTALAALQTAAGRLDKMEAAKTPPAVQRVGYVFIDDSSMISGVYYHAGDGIMVVDFGSGHSIRYEGVELGTVFGLLAAKHKNAYFTRHIGCGRYRGSLVSR